MFDSDNLDRPAQPDNNETLVLKARSHGDLIAVVAALSGFHPTDSFVALAMADNRVRLVVRAGLPAPTADVDVQVETAGHVLTQVIRVKASHVVVIGYGPSEAVDPVVRAALDVADGIIEVADALRVTDGRFFPYLCSDDDCAAPQGVPFDTSTSTVMAQAVHRGIAVLPDRAAVADTIAALTGPEREAMSAAVELAAEKMLDMAGREGVPAVVKAGSATVASAMARYEDGGRCDDDEMARLLVALIDPDVRADAWEGTDREAWQEHLWRDATRRAPSQLVAAPASLLAFTAWRRGDGALARIAVDRALDADAQFTMGLLMREVLDSHMPPSAFPGWDLLPDAP